MLQPVTGFLLIDTLMAGDFAAFRSALWYLILERMRVGGEDPGRDGVAGTGDLHPAAAGAGRRADCRGGDAGAAAEGGGEDLSLAQVRRGVPASSTATGYQLIN